MKKELLDRKATISEYIFRDSYIKSTAKQIANILDIPGHEMDNFEKILYELECEGKIYIDDSKRVCLIDNKEYFVCKYEAKSKGFGFALIISDVTDKEDLYIARENNLQSFNGDIVLVKQTKEVETGKRREGNIIKIIKRANEKIVGTFVKSEGYGFVVPITQGINDIYIPGKACGSLKDKDRVKVEIIRYATETKKAEGRVVEVIGSEGDKDLERTSIFANYGIDTEFKPNVLDSATSVAKTYILGDLASRRDLRQERTYTIDSEDAKDLDDAVIVKILEGGNFKLSVHIADVSHYVTDGSPLDNEAVKRGTSIYTPGKVVPMLPKELSNGICSLNAGEPRLTLSVDAVIDKTGKVISTDIYKGLIIVTKKMTYEKVAKVLDRSDKDVLFEYTDYIEDIALMEKLAKILRAKRFKDGSINFNIPESKIILDDKGEVIDVKPYEQTFANNIVEEFMLMANQIIAETFFHLEAPFIYRVHDLPDEEKLKELNEVLANMGTVIKGIKKVHPKAMAEVLDYFETLGDEQKKMIASSLILRSLKLAKYSEVCGGHFGLNFEYYCHFTSPIRRYPDLFIHRVISRYIETGYNLEEKELRKLTNQAREYAFSSSEREKLSTQIERDFDDMYKAKYMAKNKGVEYMGTISGITKHGIYVKLENTVEGMITMTDLTDDYYVYDEKNIVLRGERTGKVYNLGQKLKVACTRADDKLKQIDFEIVGE